jgi:hypothetical protein
MGEHIGPLLNRMAHRVNRNKASEFGQKRRFDWRGGASAKPEQTQEKKAPVTGHGDFLPSKPRMKQAPYLTAQLGGRLDPHQSAHPGSTLKG